MISVSLVVGHNMYCRISRKINKSPPGPIGLPFIGTIIPVILHFDKKDKLSLIMKLSETYGDIYYFSFLNMEQLWISDSKLLKKVLTDKRLKYITNDRPLMRQILFTAKDGTMNFANLNGDQWTKRRKLFLSIFNKMLTTKFMNKICGNAIKNVLIPKIKQNKPFNLRDMMQYISFQTIFYANFNRYIDINDPTYIKLKEIITTAADLASSDEVLSYMTNPKFPKEKIPQKVFDNQNDLSQITNKIMDERRNELILKGINYVNNSNNDNNVNNDDISAAISDLEFDSYLDYLLKLVDEGKISNAVAEVEMNLLFAAGFQNVTFVLEYCMLLLAKYPEIQHKIRNELCNAHGIAITALTAMDDDTEINDFDLSNTAKCPNFRAFIYEGLRLSCFARSGGVHCANKEFNISWKGRTYKILENVWILYNIEHIMKKNKNENWKCYVNNDLNELYLDNWLDDNNKFKINESFCLFGYGQRDCPGKSFAVKQIQCVLGYVLMNYKMVFSENDKNKNPNQVSIKLDHSTFSPKIDPEIPIKFTK